MAPCPELESYAALAAGAAPPAEAETLLAHLETCAECAKRVETLGHSNTLLEDMRRADVDTHPSGDAVVQHLITRARALGDPHATAPSAEPDLDFLAPAQQVDEIGRLGGYRLLRVLGAGGMGVVFEAEDPKLKRRVALKAMKSALASKSGAAQRFLREAQAAARLNHDHIMPIFQVGEDQGVLFLAMPLLGGESLEARLRRDGALPAAEVVRLGKQIAAGLAAAHGQGLIHRDIKPANVWLECRDQKSEVGGQSQETGARAEDARPTSDLRSLTSDCRVKILDFGLARFHESAQDNGGPITESGVVVGTPSYMAPEQARSEAVDARADLFSLGCVLYRMATGVQPFQGPNTLAVLRALELEEPPPPRTINREIPEALSALVIQLIEKEPGKRPSSARDVIAALTAMEGQATSVAASFQLATAPRQVENLPPQGSRRKRRNFLMAAAILLVLAPLSYFYGATVIRFANNQGELVIQVEDKSVEVTIIHNGVQVEDKPSKRVFTLTAGKGEIEVLEKDGVKLATKKFELTRGGRITVTITWAELAGIREKLRPDPKGAAVAPPLKGSPLDQLDPAKIPAGDRFAWQPKELVAVLGEHRWRHWGGVQSVDVHPGGKLVLSGGYDNVVRLWDMETDQEKATFPGGRAVFSPGGKKVAIVHSTQLSIWDVATHKEHVFRKDLPGPVLCLAISADGETIATGGHDKKVTLWDAATGQERAVFQTDNPVYTVVIASDGQTIAATTFEGKGDKVYAWDVATRRERLARVTSPSYLAFAPDGKTLAFTEDGYTTVLWDVTAGKERLKLRGPDSYIGPLAFSPDGKELAWVVEGNTRITLWDTVTGKQRLTSKRLRGGSGSPDLITVIAYTRDGRTIVSGGYDGTVRLWDTMTGEDRTKLRGHTAFVTSLAFAPDGQKLASASGDGTVRLWDTASGKEQTTIQEKASVVLCAAYAPDGKAVASGGNDGMVRFWDPVSGKQQAGILRHGAGVMSIAMAPDGKSLASGGTDGVVRIWNLETQEEQGVLPNHVGGVTSVAFTADGKTIASASQGSNVRLWDVDTGKMKRELSVIASRVAFTPDRELLATSESGVVRLWDPNTGESGRTLRLRDGNGTHSIAFAPDGKMLAAVAHDHVMVSDVASGKKPYEWTLPGGATVAFAPDGQHLAVGNANGTIYIVRLSGPAKTGATDASLDPDRRAAEWVLSIGGTIRVNEDDRDIKLLADLPKERFRLTIVGLATNPRVNDAGLANFQGCKHLRHVGLSENSITGAGLVHFKDSKELRVLNLGETWVDDAGLANFKDCKNLEILRIANTRIGDAGLAHFKDCKKLSQLVLGATRVSDAGLAHLPNWKNLSDLDLRRTQVSDAGLEHIKPFKNLTVWLEGTKVTAAGVAALQKAAPTCTILWDDPERRAAEWALSIGGTIQVRVNAQDREIKAVAQLPQDRFLLTSVEFRHNEPVTDAEMAHLKDCKNLTELVLSGTRVTDAGLAHLKDCKNLTVLVLPGVALTDAGLAHFKDCKNLVALHLTSAQVSDAGLAHFQDCKNLKMLELYGTRVSDAGAAYFKDCKNLTFLVLGNTQVGDAGLAHFKGCNHLAHLNVAALKMSDAAAAYFKECTKLTFLNLSNTQVSDAGLADFKDCKSLMHLALANTPVSDAGLAHLKDCKNVFSLGLNGTRVSDAGLAHVKDWKDLTSIDLRKTKVSFAGIDRLRQTHPACRIEWDGGVIEPTKK